MKFDVYFEIYGKKMKARVDADSISDAKYRVIAKVKFHKVEEVKDVLDFFKDIFK